MSETEPDSTPKIIIKKDGPYKVQGSVPFIKLTQVCSEYGEPLEWQLLGDQTPDRPTYLLCRCGKSATYPFCDGSHKLGFDGTETARTDRASLRVFTYKGPGLTVKKDSSLCMQSGFCVLRNTSVSELAYGSIDPTKRDRAIKMVYDCPSSSLTCRLPEDPEHNLEPDLPMQIAETIEITSYGPIRAPIFVMGYLPIERSDGVPFLPLNRVSLCTCGSSRNKPLCDGTHRFTQEAALRRKARENNQ